MTEWEADPVTFFKEMSGMDVAPWQADILRAFKRNSPLDEIDISLSTFGDELEVALIDGDEVRCIAFSELLRDEVWLHKAGGRVIDDEGYARLLTALRAAVCLVEGELLS